MARRFPAFSALLGVGLALTCLSARSVFSDLILDNKTVPNRNTSDIILQEHSKDEEGSICKLSPQIVQFLLDETTARVKLEGKITELSKKLEELKPVTVLRDSVEGKIAELSKELEELKQSTVLEGKVAELSKELEELKQSTVLEGKVAEWSKELEELKQATAKSKRSKAYLTDESTVVFSASVGSHLTGLKRDQTIIFDTIITNIGNAYSLMTGRFVCPINGLYLFSATILSNKGDRIETELALSPNGSGSVIRKARIYSGGYANRYGSGTNTVLLELKVGDELWIRVYNGLGTFVFKLWSTFSGVLLKPS